MIILVFLFGNLGNDFECNGVMFVFGVVLINCVISRYEYIMVVVKYIGFFMVLF